MKAIVPVLKNIPAVQVVELANMLLTHSSKMEQIKTEYRFAKSEMNYRYKLQKKALDHDLIKFKEMAKLQQKRFNHGHVERMKLLKTTQKVAEGMASSNDTDIIRELKGVMKLLLKHYRKNCEGQIDF
jgi:hypothetical protein